jgi:hypothetical protein
MNALQSQNRTLEQYKRKCIELDFMFARNYIILHIFMLTEFLYAYEL